MIIHAIDYKSPPKTLSRKWNKKLENVKSLSDKNTIIFLGEILELLTNEKADFHCAGTVDYDIFSACDFQWKLKAGKGVILRSLERDISDGLQRVEVETDYVLIEGLEEFNFSWNGECGACLSTLDIGIQLNDTEIMAKIVAVGKDLFEKFEIKNG